MKWRHAVFRLVEFLGLVPELEWLTQRLADLLCRLGRHAWDVLAPSGPCLNCHRAAP